MPSKARPKAEGRSPPRKAGKAAKRSRAGAGSARGARGGGPARRPPAEGASGPAASRRIDARIRDLGGWRGETLARLRALILEAEPGMVEEVKWVKPSNPWGVPVWSCDGIVCTGEAYEKAVKLTFARGASLPDPSRLFNASLEGGTRRAIDVREGETLDARAFQALVKAAVELNGLRTKR